MSEFNFTDKTVWVTGAGRGIGLATAMQFKSQGATVVGFDKAFPYEYDFETVVIDLENFDAIAKTCRDILERHPNIDVLVNAAGILRLGLFDEFSLQDWQATFNVNVTAVFHLLQQLTPRFKKQQSGVIVNVASNAARVPRVQMAAYCASKAALLSFSQCVGLELAKFGVRCNVVSPGSTLTPMLDAMLPDEESKRATIEGSLENFKCGIPLQKIASADEIAHSIMFLASDLAAHITMKNLVVDGGASLSA